MGRPKSRHIPCALVHVVQRCHDRRYLLRGPGDKDAYARALQETAELLGYGVVSWCVQDNHVHLLLKTPPAIRGRTLAAFMHRLNSRFGHRHNALHQRSGSFWSGRYRARWIPFSALHLLKLVWYVEGNTARRKTGPVEAADWPWCSAYWFLAGTAGPVASRLGEAMAMLLSGLPEAERPDPRDFLRQVLAVPRGPGWEERVPHAGRLRAVRRWLGAPVREPGLAAPSGRAARGGAGGRRASPCWSAGVERRAALARPGPAPGEAEAPLFPLRRRPRAPSARR